jgi:hypothetical protein
MGYVCPWQRAGRPHIRASAWSVPLAWFVPFAGEERWISLGDGVRARRGLDLRTTAQVGRTLVYLTPIARARRRVARGRTALHDLSAPGRGESGRGAAGRGGPGDLAAIARWLEGFHPRSLVELDYGGLVHLLTDDALRADESAAEIAAAVAGMSRGHCELAQAMYGRARARWRMFREFEQVN